MAGTMEVDALIVGGGPVGLSLALGLQAQGLGMKVVVLEKCRATTGDWSKAYSYRIDGRGIALFRNRLGLLPKLEAAGVASEGFVGAVWRPDGSVQKMATGNAATISLGYWIQRPILTKLLESELLSVALVEGDLQHLVIGAPNVATVLVGDKEQTIKAKFVFGCDGANSAVREALQAKSEKYAHVEEFAQHTLQTPSTGLTYKAVLFTPPEDFEPGLMYRLHGSSGFSLSLLPFAGKRGEPRPLAFSQAPDHPLHRPKTPDEVYRMFEENFPQIDRLRERLPNDSAVAWSSSRGTVFPPARWCRRASLCLEGSGVALLGDALHSFPPDLGQGVNAGFKDVSTLLELWPVQWSDTQKVKKALEIYSERQVPEAEAICHLLPVGMPYQYRQPLTLGGIVFRGGLLLRGLAWKVCPCLIYPPVIFMVTEAPPAEYSEILQRHRQNNRRLLLGAAVLSAGAMTLSLSLTSHLRAAKALGR